MRKHTITLAACAAVMLAGFNSNRVQAAYPYGGFGLHVGGKNVQLSVGTAPGARHGYVENVGYRRPYSNPRWYGHPVQPRHYWQEPGYWHYAPRYPRYGQRCDYAPPPRRGWHDDRYRDHHHGRRH